MITDYMTLFSAFVRDLPNFSGFADAVLQQAEDLQAVVSELISGFSVDSAEGPQLDMIGESLGLSRKNAADDSDETYRAYIKAKLAIWRWDGTNGSVPALLTEAFPGQGVTFDDNSNMSVSVGNTGSLPGAAEDVLPVPAGVSLEV